MPQQKNYKVKVSKDGPYLVSGGVPLCDADIVINEEGESVAWRKHPDMPRHEGCALCRCGGSSNKPFCDGSHVAGGFDGTETASTETVAEQSSRIKGPKLTLDDAEALCAGARFCDRAGTIWKLVKKADEESVSTAIQEACDCPSGRLVLRDNEGKVIEPELEPGIAVTHDPASDGMGPLWGRGGITVESAEGKPYEVRNRVTLCRCGKSRNKPFCDASHRE